MRRTWRSAIRTSSFLRKELVETLRQPRLVATLVLAPFVILLLFGAGLKDRDPQVATVFVVPENDILTAELERFATEPAWRLRVQAITSDQQEALARLERDEIDLVVVFPEDAAETVRNNERATVILYHNLVDPIESRALGLATRAAVDRLNQHITRSFVAEGQVRAGEADERLAQAREHLGLLRLAVDAGDEAAAQAQLALLQADVVALSLLLPAAGVLDVPELAGDSDDGEQPFDETLAELALGLDELSRQTQAGRDEIDEFAQDLQRLDRALAQFQSLSPETVVSPFEGRLRRLAPARVGLTDFFAPGVVVLLLQHMLVTLVGLSVVRDEQLGTMELIRVSPLTSAELLVGKYLAYLLLGAVVSTLLVALLVVGLGVPLVGSLPALVATLAAVLFTAVGIGFVVALLARTDSQAVQYAMLVLLASIFLTGFLISLERIVPALRVVAWLLPPTYGITLLRDVMLRGTALPPLLLLGLVGIGAAFLAVSWLLLRRRLEPVRGRRRARRTAQQEGWTSDALVE